MKKLFTLFLFFVTCNIAIAQSGANDPTFNLGDVGFGFGDGASSSVYTTSLQSDGKILIGGEFTRYNGTNRNHIARLNADGTLDASFDPGTGANNNIHTTALQSDGKILIGGWFTSYNGTGRNYIARLNADGTLDTSFDPGAGANDRIHSIALQSDGKILIGGWFTSYNGTGRNYVARLNADGTLDTSFDPGAGANYIIETIVLQSDSKIIIGGGFTNYNGTGRNRIARINTDGTIDISFDPGLGANDMIYSITPQPDGKILIGGWFTSYNGAGKNHIARLTENGELDASFNSGTGANNSILTTALQPDGKIIIGGSFTSYNGTGRNRIARLNSDGTLDVSFTVGSGSNNTIWTTALQSDGKIIIGGEITSYNSNGRNYIARLSEGGALDEIFYPGTAANFWIYTTTVQPDGKILIGGRFTSYNGTSKNRIARLNSDGTLDDSFITGTGTNNSIWTTVLQSDGKIIIGGDFTSYNGTSRNRITRLNPDGTLDASFTIGTGANGTIYSVALQPDGKILLVGGFTSYNGTSRDRIARLNADGTLDASFTPGFGANNLILTTALQSDGKILIGGFFTNYNTVNRNYIARLNANGTLDATFDPGVGANSVVWITAIQPDGKILLGGDFTSYNGTSRNYIARLNSNGTLDGGFTSGDGANNTLRTIVHQPDGKILLGGSFTSYDGIVRNRFARLNSDGTLDASFDPGTGANNTIWTTALQSDGKIIIGGEFISYNGIGRNRIARIFNCYSTTESQAFVECVGFSVTVGTSTYNTTGVYIDHLTNAAGCDSIVTTEITITTIDKSTTLSGNTLTADESGATYQWLDCDNGNAEINGATSQSYTATASGNYAVEITKNGCTEISNCVLLNFVGVSDNKAISLKVYPNPTSGEFVIESSELNSNYQITDVFGKIIAKGTLQNNITTINLSQEAAGVYFLKTNQHSIKIVKQ
jgi:uncharacterized delta-60 repeat protein